MVEIVVIDIDSDEPVEEFEYVPDEEEEGEEDVLRFFRAMNAEDE